MMLKTNQYSHLDHTHFKFADLKVNFLGHSKLNFEGKAHTPQPSAVTVPTTLAHCYPQANPAM